MPFQAASGTLLLTVAMWTNYRPSLPALGLPLGGVAALVGLGAPAAIANRIVDLFRLNGAIGMTYETDCTWGIRTRREDGSLCTFRGAVAKHFVALSTNAKEVGGFGIDTGVFMKTGIFGGNKGIYQVIGQFFESYRAAVFPEIFTQLHIVFGINFRSKFAFRVF